jgi:hypothetical protein
LQIKKLVAQKIDLCSSYTTFFKNTQVFAIIATLPMARETIEHAKQKVMNNKYKPTTLYYLLF